MCDEAFIAGMLHDVGKIILAERLSSEYSERQKLAAKEGISKLEAEKQIFGVTHAEVGAYLLGIWGLPDPVVEAVAFHHHPADCFENKFSPLTAVHITNTLANFSEAEKSDCEEAQLDFEYIAKLEMRSQLPRWQEIICESKIGKIDL